MEGGVAWCTTVWDRRKTVMVVIFVFIIMSKGIFVTKEERSTESSSSSSTSSYTSVNEATYIWRRLSLRRSHPDLGGGGEIEHLKVHGG